MYKEETALIVKNNVPIKNLVKKIFREVYGVEDDTLYQDGELRERIRNAVKILRGSYKPTDKNSDCDSFYSYKDIRDAYMIAYCPYYIEPARYVMENLIDSYGDCSYGLGLNFFACGPCPELYGTLLALRDKNFRGKVFINTYDAEKDWIRYQLFFVTRNLREEFFPIEYWAFCPSFLSAIPCPFLTLLLNVNKFSSCKIF